MRARLLPSANRFVNDSDELELARAHVPRLSRVEVLTLLAAGNSGGDRRSGPGWALDSEGAVECLDSVGQATEAGSKLQVRPSDPVVDDLDDRRPVLPQDAHGYCRRSSVLRDIRERLGDEIVRGSLDLLGQGSIAVQFEVDRYGRALGERTQGRFEAADARLSQAAMVAGSGALGGTALHTV
jgi:hypothetical protein